MGVVRRFWFCRNCGELFRLYCASIIMTAPNNYPMLLVIILAIVVTGCAPSPPWPHRANLVQYDALVADAASRESDVVISPAGARAADDGIYIDLLFQSMNLKEQELLWAAARWSERISMSKDGVEYIDVTDSELEPVRLYPWRNHKPFFLPLTRTYEPGAPANRIIPSQGEFHRVVQSFVFRTNRKILPGRYMIRLTKKWDQREQSMQTNHEWVDVEVR